MNNIIFVRIYTRRNGFAALLGAAPVSSRNRKLIYRVEQQILQGRKAIKAAVQLSERTA
jgi:hypothetical protein